MSPSSTRTKAAVIQMCSTDQVETNLAQMERLVRAAAEDRASLVVVAATRHNNMVIFIRRAIRNAIIVFSFAVEFFIYFHYVHICYFGAKVAIIIIIFVFLYKAFCLEDSHSDEVVGVICLKRQRRHFLAILVSIGDEAFGITGRVFNLYQSDDLFREGVIIFDNTFFSQGRERSFNG